jgi:BA14K-like protein
MNPGKRRFPRLCPAPGRVAHLDRLMQYVRSVMIAAALATASFSVPAQAGDHGDAALAGVAGFAVGTLFGNATARPRYYTPAPVYVAPPPPVLYQPTPVYYAPAPWTPEWYAYCARKYGSFDPQSGTFLGFDGYRHMCI